MLDTKLHLTPILQSQPRYQPTHGSSLAIWQLASSISQLLSSTLIPHWPLSFSPLSLALDSVFIAHITNISLKFYYNNYGT